YRTAPEPDLRAAVHAAPAAGPRRRGSDLMAAESGDEPLEITERQLRIAEALLFASSEPLAASEIAPYLGEEADAELLLAELQRRYAGRGVNVVRRGDRWAL